VAVSETLLVTGFLDLLNCSENEVLGSGASRLIKEHLLETLPMNPLARSVGQFAHNARTIVYGMNAWEVLAS
jgi:hypothetical protein